MCFVVVLSLGEFYDPLSHGELHGIFLCDIPHDINILPFTLNVAARKDWLHMLISYRNHH